MKFPPLLVPLFLTIALGSPPAAADESARAVKKPAAVTLDSLLAEMADLRALARYPAPEYRQKQASSYNRRSVARDKPGWITEQDGVSWIREEVRAGQREWVIMEHEGPGCLTKLWTPFFYYRFGDRVGPRVRVYLDGAEAPVIDEHFIELLTRNEWPAAYGPRPPKQNRFEIPSPFARFTARAGDLYLPIPFARSCKVTLDGRAFYNSVNYRAYAPGTEVESFTLEAYRAAAGRLARAGKALLDPPPLAGAEWRRAAGEARRGRPVSIELSGGPGAIEQLEVRLDGERVRAEPSLLRALWLELSFDGEPCAGCPLGDFFGCADSLHPGSTRVRLVTAEGRMLSRWVMPYRESARVAVRSLGGPAARVELAVSRAPWEWDERSMHFHASWRPDDVRQGHQLADWNFVSIEGRGVYVGDIFTVLNLTHGWWGEGDEKVYVDDSWERGFPDHFGTGTEDYYGWAGGVNPTREDIFSHPFLANLCVGSTPRDSTRGFNVLTRVRGLDAIPFGCRLVFDMEASPGLGQRHPWNLLGYSAVTFWYARPGAASNRPPRPRAARRPIMSLQALDRRSEELRRQGGR